MSDRCIFRQEITTNGVGDLITHWCELSNKNTFTGVFLAQQICRFLKMAKNYETLEMFLEALPENDVYSANEQIVRARISLAYEKKNFRQVYNLIKVS